MKKQKSFVLLTLCWIIFLLFNIELSAQGFIPFPDSAAIWRTNWSNIDCFLSGSPPSQYQYVLKGDTLINQKTYIQIFRTGYISYICPPISPYTPDIGYQGAYRQEINSQQLFLVLPDSTNEILLYDFSMNIGDTVEGFFCLPGISSSTYITVYAVDSILINAEMRKRIHVSGDNSDESIYIEGIGSIHGLLDNINSFEGGGELICFRLNDSIIYVNNPWIDCQLATSNPEPLDHMTIKIQPNPAKDFVYISGLPKNESFNYLIYDTMGRIIKEDVSEYHTININNICNGMYYISLYLDGGSSVNLSFIISH